MAAGRRWSGRAGLLGVLLAFLWGPSVWFAAVWFCLVLAGCRSAGPCPCCRVCLAVGGLTGSFRWVGPLALSGRCCGVWSPFAVWPLAGPLAARRGLSAGGGRAARRPVRAAVGAPSFGCCGSPRGCRCCAPCGRRGCRSPPWPGRSAWLGVRSSGRRVPVVRRWPSCARRVAAGRRRVGSAVPAAVRCPVRVLVRWPAAVVLPPLVGCAWLWSRCRGRLPPLGLCRPWSCLVLLSGGAVGLCPAVAWSGRPSLRGQADLPARCCRRPAVRAPCRLSAAVGRPPGRSVPWSRRRAAVLRRCCHGYLPSFGLSRSWYCLVRLSAGPWPGTAAGPPADGPARPGVEANQPAAGQPSSVAWRRAGAGWATAGMMRQPGMTSAGRPAGGGDAAVMGRPAVNHGGRFDSCSARPWTRVPQRHPGSDPQRPDDGAAAAARAGWRASQWLDDPHRRTADGGAGAAARRGERQRPDRMRPDGPERPGEPACGRMPDGRWRAGSQWACAANGGQATQQLPAPAGPAHRNGRANWPAAGREGRTGARLGRSAGQDHGRRQRGGRRQKRERSGRVSRFTALPRPKGTTIGDRSGGRAARRRRAGPDSSTAARHSGWSRAGTAPATAGPGHGTAWRGSWAGVL